MIIKKIINPKTQRLSKLLADELGLGYGKIQKIIRCKDLKIEGKRVSKDVEVLSNECVEVFLREENIDIIYENNDLLVVLKPYGVETVSDEHEDFKTSVEKFLGYDIFAVHRLDRNTQGLVIFAKNYKAKKSLDDAIKYRRLQKFYIAKVVGCVNKDGDKLIAFLKKDEKKSLVYVSDIEMDGYEKIETNYKVLEKNDSFSILEVELITGKTHQIRAHLSHIGYPILGDEKYGNNVINKKFNKKYQCLCASKLVFHFSDSDYLSKMNGMVIELDKNNIKFYKSNL